MLNNNISFNIEAHSTSFDDVYFAVKNLLVASKDNIIFIPDFVIMAKQKLKLSADFIKLGIVVVSKRDSGMFYLERISEQYTDQRRHYILYDGFIRNRILIRAKNVGEN